MRSATGRVGLVQASRKPAVGARTRLISRLDKRPDSHQAVPAVRGCDGRVIALRVGPALGQVCAPHA